MNDVIEMLGRAADSIPAAPTAEAVEADVRRGHAALVRRRVVQLTLVAPLAVAAVVGAGVVIGNDQGSTTGPPPAATQHPGPGRHATSVRLVSYDGEQLDGFIVDQIPEGWELQGSNAYRLTIAPIGDTSSPDAFTGKLVVTLLSRSAPQHLPNGTPVDVGGNDGVVSHGPPADTLTYVDDGGKLVQVQAWTSALGWSDEQLAQFAAGVQVTGNAQAGVG
jgi:hypothetical protein